MKNISVILVIIFVITLFFFAVIYNIVNQQQQGSELVTDSQIIPTVSISPTDPKPTKAKAYINEFVPLFEKEEIISESSSMYSSKSNDWWVNSGGQFIIQNGIASTMKGEASIDSRWFNLYRNSSPIDTDKGLHPQNLFRLVTKKEWKNFDQQLYFRIITDNLSESHNRNSSNGVLLFNRYQNGDNLYYVGVRVDGDVVIKKKINGKYYTLAQFTLYPGDYNHIDNPNLIPKNKWIGIRSVLKNDKDSVFINMLLDINNSGEWKEIISIEDKDPGLLAKEGHAGIRTDFMDVEFKDYSIRELLN